LNALRRFSWRQIEDIPADALLAAMREHRPLFHLYVGYDDGSVIEWIPSLVRG